MESAMLDRIVAETMEPQSLLRLPPSASVAEAAKQMAEHHVGAMLVFQDEVLRGIFTERDMLERVVAAGLPPEETRLEQVMTADPATIASDDTLLEVVERMKERRTRYLLVKRGGSIVGVLAMRDLLKAAVESHDKDVKWIDDLWEGFPV